MAPSGSRTLRPREGCRGGHAPLDSWHPPLISGPKTDPPPVPPSNYKSSLAGGYVPRVVHLLVAAKRGEFRLELAESRCSVPEWTSARTLGQSEGVKGGLELVDPPGDPPSLV